MYQKENYGFLWQKTNTHGAKLLRVYGQLPEVVLPEQIDGYRIEEIGAYCFAESKRLPKESGYYTSLKTGAEPVTTEVTDICSYTSEIPTKLRPLNGSYIENVVLPDPVTILGSLAFYNCTGLKELSIGRSLMQIGSDAFMNCKKLYQLVVRCGVNEASGVRQILAQISSDMEVCFGQDNEIEAKVLFPEYYESYDEIAPAHLFGRNIEGEGFRARQCFIDGRIDLGSYDKIFPQACVDESLKTLGRMAENRLRYPSMLSEVAKQQYADYIGARDKQLMCMRVKERELSSLEFFCKKKLVSKEAVAEAILLATRENWTEGAASLLQYKSDMDADGKKRYEFDEF